MRSRDSEPQILPEAPCDEGLLRRQYRSHQAVPLSNKRGCAGMGPEVTVSQLCPGRHDALVLDLASLEHVST